MDGSGGEVPTPLEILEIKNIENLEEFKVPESGDIADEVPTPLEIMEIKNIENLEELKAKLNEFISAGKDFEYDVSAFLKDLFYHRDPEVVLLTIRVVAEFAKCEQKREIYAIKDFIEPIVDIIRKEYDLKNTELIKHSCRALGNLCCECDAGRDCIVKCNGVPVLIKILKKSLNENKPASEEVKLFACKALSNFALGEQAHTEALVAAHTIPVLTDILNLELKKKDEMNDDLVSTVLLILFANNENTPEFLYEPEVNTAVLNILKETVNYDVSDLCLDILHVQAQNDSVKSLLAKENGVHLVCSRLEELIRRQEAGQLTADEEEVQRVMRQACDLIVMVLTGDEAMELLYANGSGPVYRTLVQWLDAEAHPQITAAVLAAGNFARLDRYCIAMMEEGIYEKLLDIFEVYLEKGKQAKTPFEVTVATRIQHGALSGIRNLSVPKANKRVVVSRGRAAPLLVAALPHVNDHHVAYKLQAAIRMLADGHETDEHLRKKYEEVATLLVNNPAALAAVAKWGMTGQSAGAVGEAPRLLGWAARQLRGQQHIRHIVKVDGCINCLINMLVVCHSIMQNESIVALTLLAIECFKGPNQPYNYETSFIEQVLSSDLGPRIFMLIEGNLTKMPVEVAENLLTFLHVTCKKPRIAAEYKKSSVRESLQKFGDQRKDFSENMRRVLASVVMTVARAPDYESDE